MKKSIACCLATVALLAGSYWVANGSALYSDGPEDNAIIATIQATAAAFNKGDAKTLAALWSDSGEYLNPDSGERIKGRQAIEKDYAAQFVANKAAQIEVTVEAIRLVTGEVAAVDGRARVLRPGELPADSTFSMILVKKEGKWLIDSVRETDLPTPLSNYLQLKDLEWMVGEWIDAEPDIEVRTVCEWIANKNLLARTYTVVAKDAIQHEGTQIIGWDAVHQVIRSWNFDSDGAFGEATWSRQGNRWACKAVGVLPSGKKASATQIITRIDDNKYTFQSISRTVDDQILPNVDEVTMVRKTAKTDGKKKGQ
jgi:uncharacterized protein (TIGR02246 family)